MNLVQQPNTPPTTMMEIVRSMQHINEMVMVIDSQNYPQKIKDDSKRLALKAFKDVKEMTDPKTIDRLVVEEYRKKQKVD